MENTLYFKDMIHCDQNNYPKKIIHRIKFTLYSHIQNPDSLQYRDLCVSSQKPH